VAARDIVVGIDVGTTATKAAAFDLEGTLLGSGSVASHLMRPAPGHVEQDPERMFFDAVEALRSCLSALGDRSGNIAAIAVTGQMAGTLGIDRRWRAVTPYDSWLDTRSEPYAKAMVEAVGAALTQITGSPPMTGHAAKMLWWKHERPETYGAVEKFVMPAAYVAGRLAGLSATEAFIDPTYLHFSCLADARRGEWSEDLVQRLGLDRGKLPAIVDPAAMVGTLTGEAAALTGLRRGTPIVAGAGDTAAGSLGAGILRAGQILDTAGTASVFTGCVDGFRPDPTGTLMLTRGSIAGQWLEVAYVAGGGLCPTWLATTLRPGGAAAEIDLENLFALAASAEVGAEGLLFVPHLDGRVLPSAPLLRGAFVGLQFRHERRHLARAVLEAIALEYAIYLATMRDLYPEIAWTDVRVVGGGSRSAVWNQIKADVLGLPLSPVATKEPACWGAALLAARGAALCADLSVHVVSARLAESVTPDPRRHAQYGEVIGCYRRAVDALVALAACNTNERMTGT
jgi:xylulokinase